MSLLYLFYTFYTSSIPLLYLFYTSSIPLLYLFYTSSTPLLCLSIPLLYCTSSIGAFPPWEKTARGHEIQDGLRQLFQNICQFYSPEKYVFKSLFRQWVLSKMFRLKRGMLYVLWLVNGIFSGTDCSSLFLFLLWHLLRNDGWTSWQSWSFNLTKWSSNTTSVKKFIYSAILMLKGTVRPDWISLRVVLLERLWRRHQPL